MSQEFGFHRQIVPFRAETEEVFAAYEVTYEFYRESEYRAELAAYCEWYNRVAEQHRQEFAAMQREANIFGLFLRRS